MGRFDNLTPGDVQGAMQNTFGPNSLAQAQATAGVPVTAPQNPATATPTTPQTLDEILAQMLAGSNPIDRAAGIQGTALQEAIPLFQPYQQAGLQGLEQFQQGTTPEGLDAILQQIMGGDTFNALQDRRGEEITNMLSAGGLTRSGETINQGAQLTIDNALGLEGLLSGRQAGLADAGFQSTSSIADLTTRIGEAIASGILGNEAQRNANSANRDTNRSNLFGSVIGGAFGAFSDPKLKTNIRKLDKVGPLDFVEWDWIDEVKLTFVKDMPTKGFLSTQVREHYPDRVKTWGGFDMIDYKHLFEDLRCLC